MSNDPQDPLFDGEPQGIIGRILPPLVLICAFGGFVALAIYAYKAGSQSVNDGELMVVEADKAPVKEKPQDPGGMQFPDQDKTIFETFSSNNQPKVERVLPTPEEPIKEEAPAEGASWVNDKLNTATTATGVTAEQVFGDDDTSPAVAEPVTIAEPAKKVEEQVQAQVKNVREELGKQAVEAAPAIEVPAAPVAEAAKPVELSTSKVAAAEKAAVKEATKPIEAITPKEEVKVVEKPKASGKQLVQLGAYRSEAEAKADFIKIQKKNPALAGKAVVINRADLGDKGIFYRLRVGTDDAKALCAKLADTKQACMAVK